VLVCGMASTPDFIRDLPLRPVPGFESLVLHLAGPKSRLSALAGPDAPPYWAYLWGGGLALLEALKADPALVAGRRVLDFGAGSGLLALAALKLGAISAVATDRDPRARAAITANAAANGLSVSVLEPDAPFPPVDLVLAGDVFYDNALVVPNLARLEALRAGGATVLVGDPFRRPLPLSRLTELGRHQVRDFGGASVDAGVFRLT